MHLLTMITNLEEVVITDETPKKLTNIMGMSLDFRNYLYRKVGGSISTLELAAILLLYSKDFKGISAKTRNNLNESESIIKQTIKVIAEESEESERILRQTWDFYRLLVSSSCYVAAKDVLRDLYCD